MRYINEYLKMNDNNWWFVTRNEIIYQLIKSYKKDKDLKILDAGCAGGSLLFYLKEKGYSMLYGIENNERLIRKVNFGNINVKVGDVLNSGFENDFFDVVVASDVIEHIDEDEKLIFEVWRILKKGGIFIVFAPAFRFLWSYHDVINEHKKRYTKKELMKKIEKCNFKVLRASYWNFSFFFPTLFLRWIKSLFKIRSNDYYSFPSFLNNLIILMLSVENSILKYINMPWGVSVFVVGFKEDL